MMERFFKSNKAVLVISLFLSLILWVYVTQDTQRVNVPDVTRIITDVPLTYRNLAQTLELVKIPGQVDVSLSGPRDRVYDIQPSELQVFVDLGGFSEGSHQIPLQAQIPRGIRVDSFNPRYATVEMEEIIMQLKPVTLQVNGEPGGGMVSGEPNLEPDQVFVRGPRSVMPEVVQVRAEIDISGQLTEVIRLLPLKAVDHLGREVAKVAVNPDMVEARIPVLEPQKDIPVEVPLTGEPAQGYKVTGYRTDPPVLTVWGRKQVLQQVERLATEPVSVEGASENIIIEVPLSIPADVRLSRETVRVEVMIAAQ